MELRHLRYLVGIADAGTFGRAAELLRVAQPALTRQIHDLEQELGLELFDSSARKATLTAAGRASVRLARHIISDIEHAVHRSRLSNSGVVGRCTIAAGPIPILTGMVPRFLNRLQRRFPGIAMTIQERVAEDQWAAIERAGADIGLGIAPTPGHPALVSETQYVHALDRAVLPVGHPLLDRTSVGVADLAHLPYLGLHNTTAEFDQARDSLRRALRKVHKSSDTEVPRLFSSIESLVSHVRAGQGWTLGVAEMTDRIAGLGHVKLDDFKAPLRTMRIWRRGDQRPVIQTVLEELRRFQDEGSTSARNSRPGLQVDDRPEFISARLDLRHLRTFAEVAKHGSLGRAAEALGVTQPALSRQMRELEYDVGVTLLDRGTRGMGMTPAGDVFLTDVRAILSVVDHIPREARRAERGTTQRCLVGAVPHPYVDRIVAAATADLEARGSRVRVGMRAVITLHQPDALRTSEIDIGVGHAFPRSVRPAPHGIITKRIFDDRICTALLAVGHPHATADALSLGELAEMPFLWVTRDFLPAFHDAVMEAFAAAGTRPLITGKYDGLMTLWSLAAQGAGWTLGWASHRVDPPAGLRAVPLRDFDMEWGGEVSYRQDESRAPVLAAIDCILANARKLHPLVRADDARLPSAHTPQVTIS
jgi:DNA-binding transcriptional LysR family regulator